MKSAEARLQATGCSAALHALGVALNYLVTLNVRGRRSGRMISLALVMAVVEGERYLVSMLGADVDWVQNVKAADGSVILRPNYGNPPVYCAAPGVSVLSTKKGRGTTTMSGTSTAAPHVAGLLLFGTLRYDGSVLGDPDGTPDAICHF